MPQMLKRAHQAHFDVQGIHLHEKHAVLHVFVLERWGRVDTKDTPVWCVFHIQRLQRGSCKGYCGWAGHGTSRGSEVD